jgi:hypothetical protein
LLLQFSEFGYCGYVQLYGGEGEVDVVFHLHTVFYQKLLHEADNGLLGIVLLRQGRELQEVGNQDDAILLELRTAPLGEAVPYFGVALGVLLGKFLTKWTKVYLSSIRLKIFSKG